jgi:hypothetical protein
LQDRYQLPILTLAILSDSNKNWRPSCYKSVVWDKTIVTFNFFMNKLLDYQEEEAELLNSKNPFGVVVATQLTALWTQPDPEKRYSRKVYLTRCLYE